jgi:lipopolysaccharide/colanic/teichoic acid biosynthesis glycosyltransferase
MVVGWRDVESVSGIDVDALRDELLQAGTTILIVSDEVIRRPSLVALALTLNLDGVRVRDLRSFYEQEFQKVAVSELSPSWFLFDIAEIHCRAVYGPIKRVVETTIAAALLLATAPLFPLIALLIRTVSPGPVFFSQERIGKGGVRFRLTKFRTMHCDPSREQGSWATSDDARIFLLGRILRGYRLDELPQLWPVLWGRLSLVGPRPEQPALVDRLRRRIEFYEARHAVRPGLTGWAQVNCGYGGSEEGGLLKLQHDLFYIKHQGLRLDLQIIARTLRAVLAGAGGGGR